MGDGFMDERQRLELEATRIRRSTARKSTVARLQEELALTKRALEQLKLVNTKLCAEIEALVTRLAQAKDQIL